MSSFSTTSAVTYCQTRMDGQLKVASYTPWTHQTLIQKTWSMVNFIPKLCQYNDSTEPNLLPMSFSFLCEGVGKGFALRSQWLVQDWRMYTRHKLEVRSSPFPITSLTLSWKETLLFFGCWVWVQRTQADVVFSHYETFNMCCVGSWCRSWSKTWLKAHDRK